MTLEGIGRNVHLWGLVVTLWLLVGGIWLGVAAGRKDALDKPQVADSRTLEIQAIAERTGFSPQAVAESLTRLAALRSKR